MKIFLDVGAHVGQTLAAVLPLDFDRIVCFEPAAVCWGPLKKMGDHRVTVERFGLWKKTCEAPLFNPGSMGAGLWQREGRARKSVMCDFVRASDWMRENVTSEDVVYMKLNCEGAECDIIDDLLNSGEFSKLSFVMIDFDVRKFEDLKHRQGQVAKRLEVYPFPRVASKAHRIGDTHAARIQHWLRLCQ